MLAVHARYRGHDGRRADIVSRSAKALSTLKGVDGFNVVGIEELASPMGYPEAVCDTTMALLADGNWVIGIGLGPSTEQALQAAQRAAKSAGLRPGSVDVAGCESRSDIAAALVLLGYVLSKRTVEGREATSLVRRGLSQNEAAAALGISKQAMSQRLQAAGWSAETAGWRLAVNLLATADRPWTTPES